MVWCVVVRCGAVWCGVVRDDTPKPPSTPSLSRSQRPYCSAGVLPSPVFDGATVPQGHSATCVWLDVNRPVSRWSVDCGKQWSSSSCGQQNELPSSLVVAHHHRSSPIINHHRPSSSTIMPITNHHHPSPLGAHPRHVAPRPRHQRDRSKPLRLHFVVVNEALRGRRAYVQLPHEKADGEEAKGHDEDEGNVAVGEAAEGRAGVAVGCEGG